MTVNRALRHSHPALFSGTIDATASRRSPPRPIASPRGQGDIMEATTILDPSHARAVKRNSRHDSQRLGPGPDPVRRLAKRSSSTNSAAFSEPGPPKPASSTPLRDTSSTSARLSSSRSSRSCSKPASASTPRSSITTTECSALSSNFRFRAIGTRSFGSPVAGCGIPISPAWRSKVVKKKLERATPALVKPYDNWLHEDYFIFHVREMASKPSAAQLLAAHGDQVAQIVRGETCQLSDGERGEILQGRISYYPNDLAVIGWNAAFLYDTNAGAETAIQLLEYANSQLLEFRHYDDLAHSRTRAGLRLPGKRWRRHSAPLAHRSRGQPVAHRLARRQRTHRTCRQRHQVPERHVLGASL